MRRMWTEDEVRMIERLGQPGYQMVDLERKLKRTAHQIFAKRSRLGISLGDWSGKDTRVLKEMLNSYHDYGAVADALGRSVASVKIKAQAVGVRAKVKQPRTYGEKRHSAYRSGQAARKHGKDLSECPRLESFGLQMAWKAGWHDRDIEYGNSVIARSVA